MNWLFQVCMAVGRDGKKSCDCWPLGLRDGPQTSIAVVPQYLPSPKRKWKYWNSVRDDNREKHVKILKILHAWFTN